MKKKNVIWMAVSRDDLQLPEYVADTAEELAKLCGVKPETVVCEVSRWKHGHVYYKGSRQRYFKIPLDEVAE